MAIYLTYLITYLTIGRGAYLALGLSSNKLHKKETFLMYQKISALLLIALAILCYLSKEKTLFYLTLINLVLLFFFYLQPTPRTTKKISIAFIVINIAFLIFNFI